MDNYITSEELSVLSKDMVLTSGRFQFNKN